jgi:hypothetical protein
MRMSSLRPKPRCAANSVGELALGGVTQAHALAPLELETEDSCAVSTPPWPILTSVKSVRAMRNDGWVHVDCDASDGVEPVHTAIVKPASCEGGS